MADLDEDGVIDENNGYREMNRLQTDICRENDNFVLVGNLFATLAREGHLKDYVHFNQTALNIQGYQAGINASYYITNGKEPTIYDREFDELYFSKTSY